jgi:pimeloyl-ACP methyl ester carboxylesterase
MVVHLRISCHDRRMNMALCYVVIFCLEVTLGNCCCFAKTMDYSVSPRSNDNFLEASFRLYLPDEQIRPDAILVFLPGTDGDGRGIVANPAFLAIGKACHAAVLGCDYRGEGLNYAEPGGGSGRALDEALSHFAELTKDPSLVNRPLLLIGYSQGGMFAFNYICLYPQRVGAFAALKAVSPEFVPKAGSFEVPGLIVAGQMDDPTRIRSIAKAFADATGKRSEWAFLFEKGTGHDLDSKIIELTGSFFAAVCEADPAREPILLNAETETPETAYSNASGTCWFPNTNVADFWKLLHQPASLHDLMSMSARPQLQGLLSVSSRPEKYECKNGELQPGILDLSGLKPGMTIDYAQVSGKGFRVDGPRTGTLPMQIRMLFEPQDLPWGTVRADLELGGEINGQRLDPLTFSISGVVSGPIVAVPSTVYLGVVSRGSVVDQKVLLKINRTPVHILNIKAPDNMKVTLEGENESDWRLNIHWTAGERLGQIYSEIRVALDSPEKGTLRIPVVGVVQNDHTSSVLLDELPR